MEIKECYLIGVDISNNQDQAVLQVVRCKGNHQEIVKTLYGTEAVNSYLGMINNSNVKGANNNESL